MSGPGIPLNFPSDLYRPPTRPTTPSASRGFPSGPSSILTPAVQAATAAPIPTAGSTTSFTSASSATSPPTGAFSRSVPGAEPAFEFTVPSLPPRLANFGRKISQMSTDFMAEFEEGPATGTAPKRTVGVDTVDVPGMGDEPVMCPFCDKPLPPVLFSTHSLSHGQSAGRGQKPGGAGPSGSSLAGPGLKRSNTTTGATGLNTRGAIRNTAGRRDRSMDPPPVAAKTSPAARAMTPVEVVPEEEAVPKITTEEMRREEAEAGGTNMEAAKVAISEEDIARWSKIAGLEVPKPATSKAEAGDSVAAKALEQAKEQDMPRVGSFPRLDPPPGASGRPVSSRASSSSSRFGFFGRKNQASAKKADEDDSDEDGGQAGGYSRLLAGGSDTEDDEEDEGGMDGKRKADKAKRDEEDRTETLHDEPGRMSMEQERPETNADSNDTKDVDTVPVVVEPSQEESPDALKDVLREVLAKLNEMSQSHTALHHSQSTLLTSLKIARSNLAMAEANTEMLEAQLKQHKPTASSTTTPITPAAQPRQIPASATIPSRPSAEDRQRPMSLQMPPGPAIAGSAPEKGGWGFWNNGKKKLQDAAQAFPANFPSPSMEKRSFDFEGSAPYSAALPGAPNGYKSKDAVGRISGEAMIRSASYSGLDQALSPPRAGVQSASVPSAQLAKVTEQFKAAESKIEAMSKELAELKKGKVEMEAELENLSQALFEEANKMVSDERKKRAEVEEALKEAREEREALRSTIKVLGGQGAGSPGDKGSEEVGEDGGGGGGGGGGGDGDDDKATTPAVELPDEFMPRDLDKHYEALRRSIHHVSDGAGTGGGGPNGFLSASAQDGASGTALAPAIAVPETIHEDGMRSDQAEAMENETGADVHAGKERSIIPPADPNPWATTSPFSNEPLRNDGAMRLPGEEKLRLDVDESGLGDVEREMNA